MDSSLRNQLLAGFTKSGLELFDSEYRRRLAIAAIWNYLHYELWRIDGPRDSIIRFRSIRKALSYYRIPKSSAIRYMKLAGDYLSRRYPQGLPDDLVMTPELAALALHESREKSVHQTPGEKRCEK